MNIYEITFVSHTMVDENTPERFASIKRHPKDDHIKVVFADADDIKTHYVLADCIEDVESMADLLHDQLGGAADEYLVILKCFMN